MYTSTLFYPSNIFFFLIVFLGSSSLTAQTFCTDPGTPRYAGEQDGYRYELWNQNGQGNACMTLGNGAIFSGEWSDILNYLARRGLGYNTTQQHQEIGTFNATYDCSYNPNSSTGNSYLSIYGWTVDPLIEFYIVEDWRNWIPSMAPDASLIDSFTIDGSTYDILENTRVNKPSILGTATFQQYFSIRRDERNSGSIDISAHFNKWESLGLDMGNLYEVSFVVEGYQSSGDFTFNDLVITVDETSSNSTPNNVSGQAISIFPNPSFGDVSIEFPTSTFTTLEIFASSGQIVHKKRIVGSNTVNLQHLHPGIYYVRASGPSNSALSRLIVH